MYIGGRLRRKANGVLELDADRDPAIGVFIRAFPCIIIEICQPREFSIIGRARIFIALSRLRRVIRRFPIPDPFFTMYTFGLPFARASLFDNTLNSGQREQDKEGSLRFNVNEPRQVDADISLAHLAIKRSNIDIILYAKSHLI